MRIVTTLADVEALASANGLSASRLQLLRVELDALSDSYGCRPSELDLTPDGPIVLLEPGDNVRGLRPLGLAPTRGGLLGSVPERVQKLRLPDGTDIYRMTLVSNNSYALTLLLLAGQFDKRLNDG